MAIIYSVETAIKHDGVLLGEEDSLELGLDITQEQADQLLALGAIKVLRVIEAAKPEPEKAGEAIQGNAPVEGEQSSQGLTEAKPSAKPSKAENETDKKG